MIFAGNLKTFAGLVVAISLGLASQAQAAAPTEAAVGGLRMGPKIHLGAAPRGAGETVIYDSVGEGQFTNTGSTPRTFIGGAMNVDGPGPQADVTSFDIYMISVAATSYTNVRARIQFWDTYNASGTPVFSNAAGTVIETDLGPLESDDTTVYTLTIDLPTAQRLNSLNGKGFAISFQGDTGTGLAVTDNLTSALIANGAMGVGTSAVGGGNGFYRNASTLTNFNFNTTDARTFTGITDARTAITVRGNATVPVTLQSFDVK